MRPSAKRVALRYMMADLRPPLGYPGGPCHVIERIEERLGLKGEDLIEKIESADKLTKEDEHRIYLMDHIDKGPAGTMFKFISISPHSQYRMDLRGIGMGDVKAALIGFQNAYAKEKSRGSPVGKTWEMKIKKGERIDWVDARTRIIVNFLPVFDRELGAQIVTVFEDGGLSAKPVDRHQCEDFEGWVSEYPANMFDRNFPKVGFKMIPGYEKEKAMRRLPRARGKASPNRVALRFALKMPAEPGVQTFVDEDNAKNLPSDLDREKEQALPLPGSATPGGAGRDIPKFEYNTPDSDSDIKPRTTSLPGDEYGAPTKYDYNMPTRRTMT